MKIDVKTNIKAVTKDLSRTQKKQIPFATANAINTTLFQLRKEMGKQTKKKLDNPTPFTQKGFMVKKANKKTLLGLLFLKDEVADYLKFQIDGGVRSNSKKFAIPTDNAKLNKYGNIPGKKSGVVKGKNQKILTINNMTGVYQTHKDKTLKLLIAFKDKAVYKIKFPFYQIGQGFINSKFNKNMINALDRALKSAK
tara:strand:- start:42 stop:629 length:588 start_codon:yes stop_codon:yes gene_type:complete